MALNPNIALSFRRPQLRSPLETYGRVQQIAANAMAAQKIRDEAASVNALRDYISGGGKLDTPEGLQGAVSAGVNPETARAYSERLGGVSKAQIDAKTAAEQKLYGRLPSIYASGDDAAWMRFVNDLATIDKPDADELLRLTGGKFNSRIVRAMMAGSKEYFNKLVSTPVASFQVSDKGVPQSVTAGGEEPSVREIPQFRYEEDQPPPTAVPQPPRMTPAPPVAPEVLDAAAAAIAEGKDLSDPRLKTLPPYAIDQAQKRAMQLRLGAMPPVEGTLQPMSAQQGQPDLAQVVNDMMATGFVTQSNLEAMRQVAGPDKDAQLAEILRSNNIQIVPDEGAGQFRSAVYRPEEGAGMQEVGYVPTTTRFKPATQGTVPGEYSLPTGEIRRREQAKRETPQEVYQKELARRRAERDAAVEGAPKPLTPVQEAKLRDNIAKDYKSAQSTIDMMLNPVSGVVAAVQSVRNLTPAQKEAITGLSGYFYSVTPSSRQADTKVKNLKGKVTEMGKAAASLTGAIGQMAVQEWRIVSDMIANLDLEGMEPSDLDNQLDIIESQAKRAAEITQDAYENQYVEEFARYGDRFRLKTPQAPAAKGGGKSSGWGKARVVGD